MTRTTRVLLSVAVLGMLAVCVAPVTASEPFLGQIMEVGFNFPPRGWATCDGQLLPISSNTALFALLGPTFGGDGRTTFALPDLRGRISMHVGNAPTLSNVTWGQRGGAETVTLNTNHLPSHNHAATLHATSTDGNQTGPDSHILANDPREDQYSNATPNVTRNAASIRMANQGGGQSFQVRNPYLGIYHCIALTGVFPSRN